MKQLYLLLLQRPALYASVLMLSTSFFWLSCRKDHSPPAFPKTFTLEDWTPESARSYWNNPQGIGVPLTRQQSGTFSTFLDTIGAYDLQQVIPLPFTGIELLNDYQLRIFNDGTNGALQLDTVVNYSSTASGQLTISWTPLGAPFALVADEFAGDESLKFFSCWLLYSYRSSVSPDSTQYTPARHYYTGDELSTALGIIAADNLGHGVGDTMALYLRLIRFKH